MASVVTGGSTNAVLHLLAIAREVGVELVLEDFHQVNARTPVVADLKPAGRYTAWTWSARVEFPARAESSESG